MSWVTVIWAMVVSVCLTLATIYLLIWFRERRSWAYLCFFVLALGVIGMAAGELGAMYARSPTEYGTAIRWGHFAYGFIAVGSLGFVHFYFGTGKGWLLGAALGLRLLAVVVNFSTGLNLHIGAIQSLQAVNFLGEPVSMLGQWTANPWVRLGQLAALVQFVYVADASFRLWRSGARESRRRAVTVGATLAFFILFASGQAGLVAAGVLRMPMIVSFPFLAVLLAMGYELTRDVLRAAQLSDDLRLSEERMTLATEAAGFGIWMWSIPRNQVWGSERWLGLFGFAPDATVTFENVMQRVHPDDREMVEGEVWRAVEAKIEYRGEYRVILPDGTQRWLAARGRMSPDPRGKPARMMGAALDITERKRAEEANRTAHELMVAVFNSVPGLLYLYTEDGRLVQWNKQHEKMTGYSSEELVNFPIQNWFAKEDQSKLAQEFSKVLSEGSTLVEMNLKLKNGERVPYSFTGTKVIIDGKPCLIGIGINISERKRAEEANRRAHELMAAVFNSVPGLLYLYTEDGQIVQWNRQHEEMTGFTAEELLNRRARDWYDEEDLSTFDKAIRTIFSEGYAEAEMKLIHKNGERVPYFLTGSKLIIDGKPHLVGIAIDISARTKAEESLRVSEARYRDIFEGAIEGIFRSSLRGEIMAANPALAKMLGYDSPEDLVRTVRDSANQVWADATERSRFVRLLEERGVVHAYECQFRRKDGASIWVSLSSRLVRESAGRVACFEGFIADISERKRAELELQQQREELAHLSRVTMLGELSGSLAHELNQPLTAILSNAQAAQRFLAQDTPDLAELREILADIVAEDKRAGEVIRRLRLLLKKSESHHQPLDLNEVVREVLKLVRNDLVNRGVSVQMELASDPPAISGDRVQLQQVIINMVMNACYAMTEAAPADRVIALRTIASGGEGVRMEIADRGCGIPPENLERVFEPFFTTRPEGMGLGLAVCRTIIGAHGGKMGVGNNAERGATFYFTIPAQSEAQP